MPVKGQMERGFSGRYGVDFHFGADSVPSTQTNVAREYLRKIIALNQQQWRLYRIRAGWRSNGTWGVVKPPSIQELLQDYNLPSENEIENMVEIKPILEKKLRELLYEYAAALSGIGQMKVPPVGSHEFEHFYQNIINRIMQVE